MSLKETKYLNLTQMERDYLMIIDVRFYVFGGILLPMAIIGLAFNSFTILVLLHPRMRNSTNVYLTALATANIVCLLNFILLYSFRYLFSYRSFQDAVYYRSNEPTAYESFVNLILRFWSPVFSTFQLYAIYLTCAVTVDRWIYLKWPLKADSICTIKMTIHIICGILFFCIVYNLPRLFEVDYALKVSQNNITYYQAGPTEFGNNKWYRLIYHWYGYLIFVYGLPFSVLVIVNIGIIKKLIETEKRKSHLLGKPTKIKTRGAEQKSMKLGSNQSPKIDPKTTFMIMAVVVAFFCCQFPYLILRVFDHYGNTKEFQIAKTICDFLAALNCCINFLIYCFFGTNFRRTAKFILCNPTSRPWNESNMRRFMNAKAEKVAKRNRELIKMKELEETMNLKEKLANVVKVEIYENEILLVSDEFDNKMEETNV